MFHLAHADDRSLLAAGSAVIKRADRRDFVDSVALLQAASAIRARAEADAAAARAAGHAEGLAEAADSARALIADELAGFAAAIDAHAQARRADIAEAAHAAVRAIVGELDDATIVARLVRRTLDRLPANGPITISVAPAMADALAARMADAEHVSIRADAALGPTDCHVRTSDGQVIASLAVQLDSLAKRWGVAA